MKLFIFAIFAIINLFTGNGYVMKHIDAIEDNVQDINFDFEGNIYVATKAKYNCQLLKLNSEKKVSKRMDIPSEVWYVNKILVTSKKDLYFWFYNQNGTIGNPFYWESFHILRENSSTFKEIDVVKASLFFLDDKDNFFYGKDNITFILRPESTVSIPIKNLEDFHPVGAVSDREGNIYVSSNDSRIALITAEALQEEIPSAQVFIMDDNSNQKTTIRNFMLDERNNLWIFLKQDSVGLIKKISNGTVQTIWTDETYKYLSGLSVKDKIFVLATAKSSSIYYITLENEVVEIPELTNMTGTTSFGGKADNDGNIYFATNEEFTPELGPMIKIRYDDLNPASIHFDVPNSSITYMYADFNETVWVSVENHFMSYDYIYYLPKGEITPLKISDIPDQCGSSAYMITINYKWKEIYANCYSDWYYAVNE